MLRTVALLLLLFVGAGCGNQKSSAAPIARQPHALTSGQPTDEQLAKARASGITTVVNLRSVAELPEYADEERGVRDLGLQYVHIPIDGETGEGLNEENARRLGALLAAKTGVLVHCASGERTGALFALEAFFVGGAAPNVALEVGRSRGLSEPALEKIVSDVMAKAKR